VLVTLTIAEGLERHAVAVFDADLPLVNAVRNGDESAFEELVRRYDRKLYRVAQGIIHNHEDAEEVVQAAFLKAYLNLYRFQGNSKFSTWLIRIAMNESFMKLRKQRSNREQPLDTDNAFGPERSSHNRLDLTDWAANPESLYSATELRQILENCLQKLQPRLRVVFVLRDIDGHSISETSGILDLTATAVKTRLSRARLLLREELTRYFKKVTLK
jgi:RNA polymerase sigma-70 factor (ECF subfamily)